MKRNVFSQIIISEEAMESFGSSLGQILQTGGVVYLEGELGAGKTTLSRGILRSFGYRGNVKSPTYTIVEPYVFDSLIVYHFDLYRLADPPELEYIGVRDYLNPGNLCLIEWPNRGTGFLPKADLRITVEVVDSGRLVNINANSDRGQAALVTFKQQV